MLPMTVIYVLVIAVFLVYTFKNKKPIKWSEFLLNGFPILKIIKKDDTQYIPGPLKLPLIGTKWQQIKLNKLHEYYKSKVILMS